jgi:AraC-like DNA-binding protein
MDLLSELVGHLAIRCEAPVSHTFEERWAVELPAGPPSLHLVRRGECSLWQRAARHSFELGEGSLLFLSGAVTCSLQARGPRLEVSGHFDWSAGRPIRGAPTPPATPDAIQFVSSRILLASRPGLAHRLPEVVIIGARQIPLPLSYRPILDGLLEELFMPRIGGDAILELLLRVLVIQALRIQVITGFGNPQGWIAALSDPVVRTCFDDQQELPIRAPTRSLASTAQRAAGRLSARVKAAAGTGPRGIAQQRRIHRVLQLLEDGHHSLERIARETGFASVSGLCRAFRREIGTTPGAYWRRVQQRRLPRDARVQRCGRTEDGL